MTDRPATHQLTPAVRADWESRLEIARRHPLTPPPEGRDEPALADALLSVGARPVTPAWDSLGITVAPRDVDRLDELGVVELAAAYRTRATTPREVVDHLHAQIGTSFPTPEGILHLMDVDEQVRESERRLSDGTARPLEGIPVGVKDIIDAAGSPTTAGSWLTGDRIASSDATVVARLREAGAIPFAMTATTEFANGAPENIRYGNVLNPWNRERYSGGSSTGSAAAVAASKMPIALGTDTGGSIRQPGSWCGIAGFKPTRGLIPRTGVASLSWTLDHVGLLGRSAADVAMALLPLVGPDGQDPLTVPGLDPVPPRSNLRGLRVGVLGGWFTEICTPEVVAAYEAAQAVYVDEGAQLVPVDLGDLSLQHFEGFLIIYAEAATLHEADVSKFDLMDPSTVERQLRGNMTSLTDYMRAIRRRHQVQLKVLSAMQGLDVLISPGMARGAATFAETRNLIFGPGHEVHGLHARNTMIFNYTGLPAIVVPSGFDNEGMPLSLQIVARPRQDLLCLQAAAAFQAVTEHHLQRPPRYDG